MHRGPQIWLFGNDILDFESFKSLKYSGYGSVRHLESLDDSRYGAEREKVLQLRIFHADIVLRNCTYI